jgi:GrpB-like predicted nucleotidyltransferase (UPF0157 family)
MMEPVAEPVLIVDYDPVWPVRFAALRRTLKAALGELALAIEHVGSTAVPGVAAKPIIDIDVVIRSGEDFPAVIDRLAGLGYQHRGNLGVEGREAFTEPPRLPRHHLYVCAQDSPELARHLRFRDYLRTHAEDAAAYGAFKREAAARYRDDRERYTEAKTWVVERILAQTVAEGEPEAKPQAGSGHAAAGGAAGGR